MTAQEPTKAGIIEYPAPGIVVTWEPTRCQHAAECVRGLPLVFDPQKRPWITPGEATVDDLVATIDRCPSYALGYRTDDGRHREAPPTEIDDPPAEF